MRTYLKSTLVIFLIVSFSDLQAQVKSGYVFGFNLSSMSLRTNDKFFNTDRKGGIHLGGFFEIPLTGKLILQPNLLFSAKGSDFKIDTIHYSLAPVYIEIPLSVAYRFGSDEVNVFLLAGPYFACGIGGLKMNLQGELRDIKFGKGKNRDLKPFDVGLNFGAGVNFNGFIISAQYGVGLANISPAATFASEMKNKVIGITISSTSRDY